MGRTGHEIEGDVRALVMGTAIGEECGDRVYRSGTRPQDSTDEDLVVTFVTSDAGQFQAGVVTLNLYVADIYDAAGHPVENIARCERMERLMADSIATLKASRSRYLFHLREAVHTIRVEEIRQSVVVAKLGFSYI